MAQNRTKYPPDLKASGRKLWRFVTTEMDLDPHEGILLHQTARVADRLDELAQAQEGAPLTVTNSKGDQVA